MTKVILDFVISANGMIARQNGDEDWLPEEGWNEFLVQVEKYQNVIIGRETYEQVKNRYEHENFDEIHGPLKVIVTRNREYNPPSGEYHVVYSPEEAVDLISRKGLHSAYIGGGGELAASFLRSKLVTELRLTVLPIIIAEGRSFVGDNDFSDVSMRLISSETKNDVITLVYRMI